MARMWWGYSRALVGDAHPVLDTRQRRGSDVEEVLPGAARGTRRRRGRTMPGAAALLRVAVALALAVSAGSSEAGETRLLDHGASDALQESSVSVSVLRALRAQHQSSHSSEESESQELQPGDSASLRFMGAGGAGVRIEGFTLRAEQDATAVGVVGLSVEANVKGAIAGWPVGQNSTLTRNRNTAGVRYALKPETCTRHPKFYPRNLKPQTPNPKPQTPNPKPQTPNSKPSIPDPKT